MKIKRLFIAKGNPRAPEISWNLRAARWLKGLFGPPVCVLADQTRFPAYRQPETNQCRDGSAAGVAYSFSPSASNAFSPFSVTM
jgi:hypothetical protein